MSLFLPGIRRFLGILQHRPISLSALSRQNERGGGTSSPEQKPGQTIDEVKLKLSKLMNTPIGFAKTGTQERAALYKLLPSSQEEMPERTMQDSYDEVLVPLSTHVKLQNIYATVKGYVRVGRVLEDADMFAVWLCLKFIDNPKSRESPVTPYTIVTILVDDISFEKERPRAWSDLRLSGHVVWSGKTSMEVRIVADFWDRNSWITHTKAYFVMGARNAETGKGTYVNKLKPNGVFEQEQWQRALMRKKRRTADAHISLVTNPPHADEQQMIFEKYMKTLDPSSFTINLSKRILPNDTLWISDTCKCMELHPHPEYRNHQNTFFGGTLMRVANELAWLTAFLHSRERPSLVYISKVEFRVPVPLDSFLKFTALVTLVEGRYLSVTTVCESTDVYTAKTTATNFFHFIYKFEHQAKMVMPSTYMESLLQSLASYFPNHSDSTDDLNTQDPRFCRNSHWFLKMKAFRFVAHLLSTLPFEDALNLGSLQNTITNGLLKLSKTFQCSMPESEAKPDCPS